MALGQGAGRAFLFNKGGQQQQAAPVDQNAFQQDSEPTIMPMGENLRATSGLITDYYQAYGNLNSYAKSMWKTHGIDVTRADYSDPESIKANDAYMQGAAYVNELKNKLSREAGRETFDQNRETTDPNYNTGDQQGLDTYDPSLNVQFARTARASATDSLAGVYSDTDLVDKNNIQIDKVIKEIQDEIDIEQDPNRLRELEREKKSIKRAEYDPNKDEDQIAIEKYRKAMLANAAKEDPPKPIDKTIMPLRIQAMQSGDSDFVLSLVDGSGEKVYGNAEFVPQLGKWYLTRNDNGETETIDLRAKDGGRNAIREIFNKGASGSVTADQLDGLDKDLITIGTGDKYAIPDVSETTYNSANEIVSKIHKRQDLAETIEPTNLKFIPGTVDNKDFFIGANTYATDMGRGFSLTGNKDKVTFEFKYVGEDGEDEVGYKTYNLNIKEDKKDFTDFVLYNAEAFGFEVLAKRAPSNPAQPSAGGKIQIEGVSPISLKPQAK